MIKMTINYEIIKELENAYRKAIPADLRRYLLAKYAEKPFPYEYSEQDLYMNIRKDIKRYEAGELDVTVKSPFY
jgi:hypothetical protein